MQGKRILLCVTGSIAAYKAAELTRLLMKAGASVQVAMTQSATRFVQPLTFEALTQKRVLTNMFDLDGEIVHVERAHDVDACLVAPATANAIARFRAGLADDIVSATLLSTAAPIVIAPAMESGMWFNPATVDNISVLRDRGYCIVDPEDGDLASGRSGVGRLAELERIMAAVRFAVTDHDLQGARVTITAGPTHESLDPVRILSNRSTGTIGVALAAAAAARGADVRLILGPSALAPPPGVKTLRVESAAEMLTAAEDAMIHTDVLIAAAAVSDFRPRKAEVQKLKRSAAGAARLELTENPDILKTLASRHPQVITVGFAAETESVEENARGKLKTKGCDVVIGNVVGRAHGFGPGSTEVVAVYSDRTVPFGPADKDAVAQFVLDQVAQLRTKPKKV